MFEFAFVDAFVFVFVLAFATRLKSYQPICVDVWPGAVWHPVSSVSVSRPIPYTVLYGIVSVSRPVNVHQDSSPVCGWNIQLKIIFSYASSSTLYPCESVSE